MKHDYPAQLAACVRERWNAALAREVPADVGDRSAGELPDPESVELLLSVAYQASLLREEERPVTFRLIVAEPTSFPAWSKVKTILRAHAARTWDAPVEAVADALSKITVDDILGWFTKCGYGVQC